MGTRHLIAVYSGGDYKVAQYGQWDGYPDGVGADVLKFAQSISNPYFRSVFRDKVEKCRWITQDEIDERNARIRSGEIEDWTKEWPELSRDTSEKVLGMINDSDDGLALKNDIEFAADSLFCEWAYVLDLDKGTFEVYEGFNKDKPLEMEDRFFFLKDKERKGYYGVKLRKAYRLDDLPAVADFKKEFSEDEEGDG